MVTYNIIRKFFEGAEEEIKSGLTLKEAQKHCSDRETSSRTATGAEAIALTEARGPWFDSYDEE